MKSPLTLLGALGLGAGLMYLLDPDRGKRRRAVARDRALHLSNIAQKRLNQTSHDLSNRAYGVYAETKSRMSRGCDEAIADATLEARIKTRLGRLTSHPHALKTKVEDGWVTLSGKILDAEAAYALKKISRMRGVKAVEDRLERHAQDEKNPALQNGKTNGKTAHWSPAARVLAAAAGGGLTIYAARRGGLLGQAFGLAGIGLLTRGVTDKSIENLAKGNGGFRVQKTIIIAAPVEQVFHLCARPENFPQFMSHVLAVEKIGDGEYRWTTDGIPGVPLEWETRVTEVAPNEKIRWESIEGARVSQTGELRFESIGDDKTRLSVDLRYTPPAGILGHAAAEFFRRDPKSEMDDDLLRMKSFLEKGKVPRDAAIKLQTKGENALKVEEIMTRNPACCVPETALREVARLMSEKDCGAIPVVENFETKKPVGIITDRDITINTLAQGKNALEMTAAEIMSFPVVTVKPDEKLEECCEAMENNKIRRMLVVDDAGVCCGIIAQADIARKAPMFETAELVQDVSARAA